VLQSSMFQVLNWAQKSYFSRDKRTNIFCLSVTTKKTKEFQNVDNKSRDVFGDKHFDTVMLYSDHQSCDNDFSVRRRHPLELRLRDSDLPLEGRLARSLHGGLVVRGLAAAAARQAVVERTIPESKSIFLAFDEPPENGDFHVESDLDVLESML
jgi:hypothetical protein